MREACEYAHARNVRVYVAANAFTFPEEIPDMAEYAKRLKDAGADAMIVSDLGAIRAIKRACPDMEVHVSTQANCTNHESANIYYELGASRVVLARELNLERISDHCSNIALYVIERTSDNFEPHAYSAELLSGRDEEFNRMYRYYKGKYSLIQDSNCDKIIEE